MFTVERIHIVSENTAMIPIHIFMSHVEINRFKSLVPIIATPPPDNHFLPLVLSTDQTLFMNTRDSTQATRHATSYPNLSQQPTKP
jgi:hypothetical protein